MKNEAKDWLPVSDLATGFSENKLPATDKFSGQELGLYFRDGQVIKYYFQDMTRLTWEAIKAPDTETVFREEYEAIEVAPDLYFVDYVKKREPRASITLTLDMKKQRALVVLSTMPTRREANISFLKRMTQGLNLSPTRVEIYQTTINRPPADQDDQLFERTNDLIGKIVQYTYSRHHTYEHYYMNHRFYAWQCLKGPEKGTADADFCDYFKIAPDIYQFIWREKVVPTVGIALINFQQMRSSGKIFGLDIPSGKSVNFRMGASAKMVKEK